MNGADWYDVRHRQLIITPDGTVKEEGVTKQKLLPYEFYLTLDTAKFVENTFMSI